MNCPVCQRAVTTQHYERGWVIGCVGERHCVQLYRGESQDELVAAWRRYFPTKQEVKDASQPALTLEQ